MSGVRTLARHNGPAVWALGISVFLSLATALPQQSLASDFASYSGRVQPLNESILLRYAPVNFTRIHTMIQGEVRGKEEQSFIVTMTMEGSVAPIAEELEWRFKVWMAVNKYDPKHMTLPFKIRMVSDRRGNGSLVEASGIDPTSGEPLRPGTKFYDELVSPIASAFRPFPRDAVSQGDDIVAWMSDSERRRYFLSGLPDTTDADIDLHQIVLGETVFGRDRAIVTQVFGDAVLRAGATTMNVDLGGYSIIDVATGSTLQGLISIEAAVSDGTSFRLYLNLNASVD